MSEVNIFSNPQDLFFSAAQDFAQRANAAVLAKGSFTVVLSGGNTPHFFFDTLVEIKDSKEKIPWNKIKFFFGDERYVPVSDIKSNYHMALEHLFSKVPVLKENIYPIPTEYPDPKDAAKAYEQTIREVIGMKENAFPSFDLLYLGLGEDAHTASLMPLSDVVMSSHYPMVASLWVKEQNMYRITLTPPVINHAKKIIFLVTGASKARAVFNVLEGSNDPMRYPAQLITQDNSLWYLDAAAASKLDRSKFP